MAHLVETMFSVRQVPWHGLGRIIEDAPDSIAAIKQAGLDWEVTPESVYLDKSPDAIPNYFANVRSDNRKVLGIVTDRYSIVQNQEAFAFTDALIGEGEVTYETAGSLREGRQVWMLARMNREFNILGDKVDPYICFTNSHDGTGAIRVLMTPVRVVCNNTLNMALRNNSRQWSTRHVGDIAAKLAEAKRTLGLATAYLEELDNQANMLADIAINEFKVREIVNELLPIDAKATDRTKATMNMKQKALLKAYKTDDIRRFRGTGWGVINAVSDFVGHAEPARKTASFVENRFAKIIGGDSLFDKAVELLRQVS